MRLPSSSSAQGPSILPKFEAFKTPTVVDTYDFVYLIPLPLLGETTSPPYTSSNVITLLFYPQRSISREAYDPSQGNQNLFLECFLKWKWEEKALFSKKGIIKLCPGQIQPLSISFLVFEIIIDSWEIAKIVGRSHCPLLSFPNDNILCNYNTLLIPQNWHWNNTINWTTDLTQISPVFHILKMSLCIVL